MKTPIIPLLDDHIHIDPRNGRGIEAAKDFKRSGGTHLCLVSKPSWSLGIYPIKGDDYRTVFEETLQIAHNIEETGLVVFPILGVHPAEISVLSERMPPTEAAEIMTEGIRVAAEYVANGKAIAIKSGRPHYEVSSDILSLSNKILQSAFEMASDNSCAVQIHAESGPCSDMIQMAEKAGLNPIKVVKHFATPDTPLSPSMLAKHEAIPDLCRQSRRFTMESDYMDENERPGAVIGPKSVPRFTMKLLLNDFITSEDVHHIHVTTPEKIYGVEISL